MFMEESWYNVEHAPDQQHTVGWGKLTIALCRHTQDLYDTRLRQFENYSSMGIYTVSYWVKSGCSKLTAQQEHTCINITLGWKKKVTIARLGHILESASYWVEVGWHLESAVSHSLYRNDHIKKKADRRLPKCWIQQLLTETTLPPCLESFAKVVNQNTKRQLKIRKAVLSSRYDPINKGDVQGAKFCT